MGDDTDKKLTCYLPASGFTNTHEDIHQWVGKVVKEARKLFGLLKITARVWAYREQGRQFLSCDLYSSKDDGIFLPITICAEGSHYLPEVTGGSAEADTFDMVESLHLVGLITQALEVDVKVGRSSNEINENVLSSPLTESQTNGKIDLSFGL